MLHTVANWSLRSFFGIRVACGRTTVMHDTWRLWSIDAIVTGLMATQAVLQTVQTLLCSWQRSTRVRLVSCDPRRLLVDPIKVEHLASDLHVLCLQYSTRA